MAKETKFLQTHLKRSTILRFLQGMQAYEKALIGGETSLVLSPDSEFFKFFGKSIKPALKR